MLTVENQLHEQSLLAGIVTAQGVRVTSSPAQLKSKLSLLIEERKGRPFSAEIKAGVRNLLRRGGFKPSGRSKPASEYLLQAALEDRFPFINNLVDINNYFSLLSGLPISLLDNDVVGDKLLLRLGREGEKYVFNEAGQELVLSGLISACADRTGSGDEPLGTPVKDSLKGKIKEKTTNVVGIFYAAEELLAECALEDLLTAFAGMLSEYGGASSTAVQVCPGAARA